MKMPENMTRWPPFSRQLNKASGNPAFAMAYQVADIMAVRLQKQQSTQRMCAIIAHPGRPDFADLAATITSVFIGYIGTDSIGSLIKRFAAKKAGVEDGRNQ